MDVTAGEVWWAELSPTRGREQTGRRPVLVVASGRYHDLVDSMTIVVPITSTDRSWPNHVAVSAGCVSGFAMAEQVRTISGSRLLSHEGDAAAECLAAVMWWLTGYLSGDNDGWTT